ncbi:MAG TPA: hypothetical protein VMH22_08690 [bacterium]|nr:hypothetical protein [bacterium]
MNEVVRPKWRAPRGAGVLLVSLLLAAPMGFCAENMQKIAGGVTLSAPGGQTVSGADVYCWPGSQSDSMPQDNTMEVGESTFVQLPSSCSEFRIGLISDARAASWTLLVSSFWGSMADDEWDTLDVWKVDSTAGNRIASSEGNLENKQFYAKGPVPESIHKKLRPEDADADELCVKLNSSPSGKAGCRIVVFGVNRKADK